MVTRSREFREEFIETGLPVYARGAIPLTALDDVVRLELEFVAEAIK